MALLPLLPLLVAPTPTPADWDVQPLVLTGQSVDGVSSVTGVFGASLDAGLGWRVRAETDLPAVPKRGVLLGPSGKVMQHGNPLLEPAGALLGSIESLARDALGADVLTVFASGTTDDGLLLYDEQLVYREGDPVSVAGIPAGAVWWELGVPKAAGAGRLCASVRFRDPGSGSPLRDALVQLDVDPTGKVLQERLLVSEGDPWPGSSATVDYAPNTTVSFDVNASGVALYGVNTSEFAAGDSYLLLDGLVLAQEGKPSVQPGRTWGDLSGASVSLSDSGSYAFSAPLSGDPTTGTVLVVDQTVARQTGQPVPGVPGASLTRLGGPLGKAPLHLDDQGRLTWYGGWSDPDPAKDQGLFVDGELIVREGDSLGGGMVILELLTGNTSLVVARDGRFVLFEAELTDGRSGFFLASQSGEVVSHPGCFGNAGVLALAGGEPALGATLDLKLASPQDTQAVAFLGVSGALALDGLGCGLALPGIGELMLGLQPGPLLLPAGKFLGASSLVTSAPLPADVSFVGLSLHLQGLLLAPFVPLEPVRLTSALSVTIGL